MSWPMLRTMEDVEGMQIGCKLFESMPPEMRLR